MSYYPGQTSYGQAGQPNYAQSQPGQQPQYPPQGQPHYSQTPPQQYGQHPQGYPAQGHPPPPPAHPPHGNAQPPPAHPSQDQQPPRPAAAAGAGVGAEHGQFHGGTYTITHRDTNTLLTVDLASGGLVKSAPGAMVHMAGTVVLEGKTKFSFGKLFTGGEMHESKYTGRGRVALAPTLSGDVITLPVDPSSRWRIGRDAFLACTADVSKERKSQGLGKALFSGEDLFVYQVHGNGLMWLKSFGAVDRIDIQAGETHIVDNGHLVAWNCDYKIERAGGGLFTSMKTGEGMVCRFAGPGSVYVQTRNQEAFEEYIQSVVPRQA